MYRVGRVRQAVEFLLHVLQDFCGGAVLWFAVVDLVQDCIENLHSKKKKQEQSATCELLNCRNRVKQWLMLHNFTWMPIKPLTCFVVVLFESVLALERKTDKPGAQKQELS